MTEEYKRTWPFGKPREGPGREPDRQDYEEKALRPLRFCSDRLTPTGRLMRRVDPVRFKEEANEAVKLIEALMEKYPEGTLYQGWLDEAKEMVAKVK